EGLDAADLETPSRLAGASEVVDRLAPAARPRALVGTDDLHALLAEARVEEPDATPEGAALADLEGALGVIDGRAARAGALAAGGVERSAAIGALLGPVVLADLDLHDRPRPTIWRASATSA